MFVVFMIVAAGQQQHDGVVLKRFIDPFIMVPFTRANDTTPKLRSYTQREQACERAPNFHRVYLYG